jgi:hypothetical protein
VLSSTGTVRYIPPNCSDVGLLFDKVILSGLYALGMPVPKDANQFETK